MVRVFFKLFCDDLPLANYSSGQFTDSFETLIIAVAQARATLYGTLTHQ